MMGHSFKAAARPETRRQVTCQEAECEAHLLGFKLVLDEKFHADSIDALRTLKHGRRYEERHEVEGWVEFHFPPGQQCFKRHTDGAWDDPVLLHGNNGQVRRHVRAADWQEDFNEVAYQQQEQRKRG